MFLTKEERKCFKIGSFRKSGEIHYWLYDRFSLKTELEKAGFTNIIVQNPYTSQIQNWNKYELDIKDGEVFDPTSLFIEATK
jgi:hypothetical protein